jgi:hypothetical protein
MKKNSCEKLWEDVLAEGAPDFSGQALDTMLGGVRRRKRRRVMLRCSALVALLAIPALFFAMRGHPDAQQQGPATPGVAHHEEISPAPAEPVIQVLSDEELFAEFPGEAIAIIGSGDAAEFVFLEKK